MTITEATKKLADRPSLKYPLVFYNCYSLIPYPDLLREFIRVAGVAPIGHFDTREQVDAILDASTYSRAHEGGRAYLAVVWGPDSLVASRNNDAWYERVAELTTWGVKKPTYVIIDSEQNHKRADPDELYRINREIIGTIESVWPNASASFRGHLSVDPVNAGCGWARNTYTTGHEREMPCSPTIYRDPTGTLGVEQIARSWDFAQTHSPDVPGIVPWLPLGWGWDRSWREVDTGWHWGQDRIEAWKIGARFFHPWARDQVDRFGPLDQIDLTVMWPGAGDTRVSHHLDQGSAPLGTTPENWLDLFIALLDGAEFDAARRDEYLAEVEA
jgi:hypothetical protein